VEKLGLTGQVVHVRQAPRAEMPAHIGCMDICVIPDSNPFGSPIVLFEFLASGKAVVAPSVAPVLDVLRSGENGMVFTKHDKKSFHETLWKVVQDDPLRASLSKAARQCVEKTHNWQANADEVLRLAEGRL
jgi:glycosyltransferase involved in cell wall biosynthesis